MKNLKTPKEMTAFGNSTRNLVTIHTAFFTLHTARWTEGQQTKASVLYVRHQAFPLIEDCSPYQMHISRIYIICQFCNFSLCLYKLLPNLLNTLGRMPVSYASTTSRYSALHITHLKTNSKTYFDSLLQYPSQKLV